MSKQMFENFPFGYQVLSMMEEFIEKPDFNGSLAIKKMINEIYTPFFNGNKHVEFIKFTDMMSHDNPFEENPVIGSYYSSRDWRNILKHFNFNPCGIDHVLSVDHVLDEKNQIRVRNEQGLTILCEINTVARSCEISNKKGLFISCHYAGQQNSPTDLGVFLHPSVFLTQEDKQYKLYDLDENAQIVGEITDRNFSDVFVFALAVGTYYKHLKYDTDMMTGEYSRIDYNVCSDHFLSMAKDEKNFKFSNCYLGYLWAELNNPTPVGSQGYDEFHSLVAQVFIKPVHENTAIIALADAKQSALHKDSNAFDQETKDIISQLAWSKVAKHIKFEPKIHQPVLFLEGNFFDGVSLSNTDNVTISTIGCVLKSHQVNDKEGILGVGGIIGKRFNDKVMSLDNKFFFIHKDNDELKVMLSENIEFSKPTILQKNAFNAPSELKGTLMMITQLIASLHLYNSDKVEHIQCIMANGIYLD